jgi:hypothetical protein
MAQGNRILAGYVQQIGGKMDLIVDHDGPSSYVGGAGNGEVINASDFGLGGIELCDVDALSSDGLNYCYVLLTGQSTKTGNTADAVASCKIRWYVLATATEVANAVDLSGKSIRLRIRGV